LLPPMALAGAAQSALGIGYKAAYLITALALQIALYGALGLVAAFSIDPGAGRGGRIARLLLLPPGLAVVALAIRSLKLGHVPMLSNAVIPIAACMAGAAGGLLWRGRGWRPVAIAAAVAAAGLVVALLPGTSSAL